LGAGRTLEDLGKPRVLEMIDLLGAAAVQDVEDVHQIAIVGLRVEVQDFGKGRREKALCAVLPRALPRIIKKLEEDIQTIVA
jgi:hypothetical protein